MTASQHYADAERLARLAESVYTDSRAEAKPRGDYATDAEFIAALEEEAEAHQQAVAEMAAFAQLAQVHATLALADAHRNTEET